MPENIMIEERINQFDRKSPYTVVVLGPPRSGTSMLAGIMRILGVYMGKCNELNHEDPRFNAQEGVESIRNYITDNNRLYEVWGWKEPSTHKYYADIKESVRNPIFIASYRNILGSVRSKIKRTGTGDQMKLIQGYSNHYTKISALLNNIKAPTICVDHERVLKKPDIFANRLSVILHGKEIDDDTRNMVNSFCEPGSYKPLNK